MSDEKEVTMKPDAKEKAKSVRLKQTDVPSYTLQDALRVPKALWDDCGGKPIAPFHLANSLELTPSGTVWRYLSGSAAAYGLTSGAYNSKEISLTELGRNIVTAEDGLDREALLQALMTPSLMNTIFTEYNGGKLPKPQIVESKLTSLGVPADKVHEVYELVMKNAKFVGVIVDTKGGNYVHLDAVKSAGVVSDSSSKKIADTSEPEEGDDEVEIPQEVLERIGVSKEPARHEFAPETTRMPAKPRVFITHGKNRKMVEQLKELLTFGQFDPVVEVEHESTAIPVPAKVLGGMRGCQAGIIHVAEEQVLLDSAGVVHKVINENVLIEIGAALALYENKVILLCQSGITLPSNLQGLYRCEYEGEQLDYTATMKLLKTFNEFR